MLFKKNNKRSTAQFDEVDSHKAAARRATEEALGATGSLQHIIELDGLTMNIALAMGARHQGKAARNEH